MYSMHALAALAIALSGLHGIVTKGPITPVCRVGTPCSAPAQVTLIFRRTTGVTRVYRTRTTTAGIYRITLPAGYYTVTIAEPIGIDRTVRPARIHVRVGYNDKLDFRIDTGIR
jgi:hypothetical protein